METEGGKKKTYRRNGKVSSHIHTELHLIGLPVLPDMKGETAVQHCQATASPRYSISLILLIRMSSKSCSDSMNMSKGARD